MHPVSQTAALPLPCFPPSPAECSVRAHRRPASLPKTLQRLAVRVRHHGASVAEVLDVLGDRGLLLMCMILATPFLVPLSLPGTSTPGGVLMAAVGYAMARGRTTWLPEVLKQQRLQGRTWSRVLMLNAWVLRRVLRARVKALPPHPIHGVILMVSAAIFVLPVPIPLANMFPAYAVVFLAVGLIQHNVVLQCAAWVLTGASAAYLAVSWRMGVAGVEALARMVG